MKRGVLLTQPSKCFQPPTVVCSICKRDGHLKDECPEDFKKIELKPLPPMTERFRDILDGLCRLCYCKTPNELASEQTWGENVCCVAFVGGSAAALACVCS